MYLCGVTCMVRRILVIYNYIRISYKIIPECASLVDLASFMRSAMLNNSTFTSLYYQLNVGRN